MTQARTRGPTKEKPPVGESRGTVLLVDDDPAITKILGSQLGQVGISAVAAHSAKKR